jgi:CTP:molybdopterin cytidylyltransferase MocA
MGRDKLLLEVEGRSLLARALAAAAGRDSVVVASPALAPTIPAATGRTVVVNDAPERGMSHSLRLADAALGGADCPLIVLLADTPYVDRPLVDRVAAALGDADVAYPVRAGAAGHPVVFGPRARREIAALPDGDTVRLNEPGEGPFLDVDTPDDYAEIERRRPEWNPRTPR